MNASSAALQVSVVSDVVCPWCYIGKRQLEQALAQWQREAPQAPAPQVQWLPFQLNPQMPAEGVSRADYLTRKFGRADGAGIYDRVLAAAREAGLELQLQRIQRQPSTLKAHALIDAAQRQGLGDAMAEALFEGYFMQGADLTDDRTLRRLAQQAGLESALLDAALDDPQTHQRIADTDADLRDQGISGVPFIIIGQTGQRPVAVSGAQGAPALLAALHRASRMQPAPGLAG